MVTFIFPYVLFLSIALNFAEPTRKSRKAINEIRLFFLFTFVGSYIAFAVWAVLIENWEWLVVLSGSIIVMIVVAHLLLRIRAHVGRLASSNSKWTGTPHPEQVEYFLTETIFRNSLKLILSFLFISFRTIKCLAEAGRKPDDISIEDEPDDISIEDRMPEW